MFPSMAMQSGREQEERRLAMQMVKIKFQNAVQDAQGALELAKRFTVICLPEDTYEVPSAALVMLDALHLSYCILETEGFDRAVRALRNSPAS